jgi:hypothetical protein
MPATAPLKDCHDNLQRDPKLKALLSAFSAFTTKYLAEKPEENEEAANDNDEADVANVNDDDDDINTFLGMVGALKE